MPKLEALLKEKRRSLGLTQTQLAARAGVSLPTIQNLESGRGNPTLNLLEKVSSVLGYDLEIVSKEPDWALLQAAGLPIEIRPVVKAISPHPKELFHHLFLAVDWFERQKKTEKSKRLEEVVAALIWAIEHHYPSFYIYFLKYPKIEHFLSQYPKKGRILKFMRMAAAGLTEIL